MRFMHDSENLYRCFSYVVENAHVANAQAVLGMRQTAQPFNTALAHLGWFLPQMALDGVSNEGSLVRLDTSQVLGRRGSQKDLVPHSGYMIARIVCLSNPRATG